MCVNTDRSMLSINYKHTDKHNPTENSLCFARTAPSHCEYNTAEYGEYGVNRLLWTYNTQKHVSGFGRGPHSVFSKHTSSKCSTLSLSRIYPISDDGISEVSGFSSEDGVYIIISVTEILGRYSTLDLADSESLTVYSSASSNTTLAGPRLSLYGPATVQKFQASFIVF